jgi:hypothetical protein
VARADVTTTPAPPQRCVSFARRSAGWSSTAPRAHSVLVVSRLQRPSPQTEALCDWPLDECILWIGRMLRAFLQHP